MAGSGIIGCTKGEATTGVKFSLASPAEHNNFAKQHKDVAGPSP